MLILVGNMPVFRVDAQECLPTRLAIGHEAQVTPGTANRIRSQSNTDSEQVGQIPAGEVMTILDGPQCMDGFLWWRINYDGIEGWTVEANAIDYFLELYSDVVKVTATANDIKSCTIETQLQVNAYGRVNSTTPSRLRDEAGTSGEQVGQVDPLDIFQVIDGPICADRFNWWQVRVNDLEGWLAEGDGDTYYVEMVTDPAIFAITITPERPLISYSASWNADGSRLAIATSNGVLIYNTADWGLKPRLLDNGIFATDLAFSPTNPNILVINSENTLLRFRVYLLSDAGDSIISERELIDGPMGGEQPAYDFTFSKDGSQLGFGGTSYDIYDTDSWARLNHLEITEVAGNHYIQSHISPSSLNASGNYGAGANDDGIVQLFDFTIPNTSNFGEADPRISPLDRGGRIQDITALEFSPDGAQLIIGDITGSLQMWNIETGIRTSFIRADNQTSISNRINDITFHSDGETLATAESDPSAIVRIFHTEELDLLTVFGANESHTLANIVSYNPNGTMLLTVMDTTIYILETENYSVIHQFEIWGSR